MKKNYSHILLDLDRTLWDIDTNSSIVLNNLYYEYKLETKINASVDTFIKIYKEFNDLVWKKYSSGQIDKKELRISRFNLTLNNLNVNDPYLANALDRYYVASTPRQSALMPYAKEVLEYLNQKYILAIITNGFQDIQEIKLQSGDLNKYFRKMYSSENIGYPKPAKQIFDYVLNDLKIGPNSAIMIGDDWEADIEGAINAGIDQVYYKQSEINKEGATHTITSLKELYKLL